jgi:putative membrane protein
VSRETPAPETDPPPRAPRAFSLSDPALETAAPEAAFEPPPEPRPAAADAAQSSIPTAADVKRGIRWGAILVSAFAALASLAAGVWFARFVSIAIERQDWVGWSAFALLAIIGFATLALILRELVGLMRLGRLKALRREVDNAIGTGDRRAEARALDHLKSLFSGRPEMRWPLARLSEHAQDVGDPGDLLKLADRELMTPLDQTARRTILKSAKRVGTVTAMSPIGWIAVGFVAIESLRLLRTIAGLYGGRPGGVGALRLARMVVGHLIATGGIALTDDLVGQFIGQDMLRRVSRRLGEGAFNGALTARIGVAAIEVCRPLPWLEAKPVRAREIAAELFKKKEA